MEERLRDNLPAILFVLGILVGAAAFAIEYADEMPWVYGIIASDYFHEHNGIEALKKGEALQFGDEGFDEIKSVLLRDVHVTSSTGSVPIGYVLGISSVHLDEANGSFATGMSRIVDFTTTLSPSIFDSEVKTKDLTAALGELESDEEDRRKSGILPYGLGLFLVSTALEVAAFILESVEKRHRHHQGC